MRRRRQPPGPQPPADLLWPWPPGSDLDLWAREREAWHERHAVDGRSELGDVVDLLRARRCGRMLAGAAPGLSVPLPSCWARSWQDRPAWIRDLERGYVPSLRGE